VQRLILIPLCALTALSQTDPLNNTKWRLDPAHGKATLSFQNGRYAAKGCNNLGGGYKIDGAKIIASQGMSTMMACPPPLEKIDGQLTALLAKNQGFRIDGSTLYLKGPDGEWKFTREPMPSPQAVTKFLYVSAETKPCTGAGPMTCLQIRENKEGPWRLFYGKIVGFEPEPGIEYRLRIKEDKIANPAADQASVVWYLDLIVEQKAVNR
jgi:heat shock protein HslJ